MASMFVVSGCLAMKKNQAKKHLNQLFCFQMIIHVKEEEMLFFQTANS